MPYQIGLPDGTYATFEDDVSEEEARQIVLRERPELFPRYEPSTGMWPAGLAQFQRMLGSLEAAPSIALGSLGDDQELIDIGQEAYRQADISARSYLPEFTTTEDISEAWDERGVLPAAAETWKWAREKFGESGAYMAPAATAGFLASRDRVATSAIGRGVGKALGFIRAAGYVAPHPIVKMGLSALAGVGTMAFQFFADNLERQHHAGAVTPEEYSVWKAAAAAPPQAAMDYLFIALTGGIGRASQIAAAQSIKQSLGSAGKEVVKKRMGPVSRQFTESMVEFPTELAQTVLERAQAGESISPSDAGFVREMFETAMGVIPVVSGFGAIGATRSHYAHKKAKLKYDNDIKSQKEFLKSDAARQRENLEREGQEAERRQAENEQRWNDQRARLEFQQDWEAVRRLDDIEAQNQILPGDVNDAADSRNINRNNDPGFLALLRRNANGKTDLNDMTTAELRKVYTILSGYGVQEEAISLPSHNNEDIDTVLKAVENKSFTEGDVRKALGLSSADGKGRSLDASVAKEITRELVRRGLVSSKGKDKSGETRYKAKKRRYTEAKYREMLSRARKQGRLTRFIVEDVTNNYNKELFDVVANDMSARGDLDILGRGRYVPTIGAGFVDRVDFEIEESKVEDGKGGYLIRDEDGNVVGGATSRARARDTIPDLADERRFWVLLRNGVEHGESFPTEGRAQAARRNAQAAEPGRTAQRLLFKSKPVSWKVEVRRPKLAVDKNKTSGFKLSSTSTGGDAVLDTGEEIFLGDRAVVESYRDEIIAENTGARTYEDRLAAALKAEQQALDARPEGSAQSPVGLLGGEAVEVEVLRESFFTDPDPSIGQERRDYLFSEVAKMLKAAGLGDVALRFEERLGRGDAEAQAALHTISIAMLHIDPKASKEDQFKQLAEIISHEQIHVMRILDLFNENEWTALVRSTKRIQVPAWFLEMKGRDPKETITFSDYAWSVYGPQDGKPQKGYESIADIEEEAVADLFRAFSRDKSVVVAKPRALMDRMRQFIERLYNAITGVGYGDAGTVMAAIASGDIAARDRGKTRTTSRAQRRERLMATTGGDPVTQALIDAFGIESGDEAEGRPGDFPDLEPEPEAPAATEGTPAGAGVDQAESLVASTGERLSSLGEDGARARSMIDEMPEIYTHQQDMQIKSWRNNLGDDFADAAEAYAQARSELAISRKRAERAAATPKESRVGRADREGRGRGRARTEEGTGGYPLGADPKWSTSRSSRLLNKSRRWVERASQGDSPQYYRRGDRLDTVARGRSISGTAIDPDETYRSDMSEDGFTVPLILEMDKGEASASTYRDLMMDAQAGNPFMSSVTIPSVSELSGLRLFVSRDGNSGVAVSGDGNISGLFKNMEGRDLRVNRALMNLAVQMGGKFGDAFDTALPHLYAMSGFRVVARIGWDDSQMPATWDKDAYQSYNKGEPDVVFFVYDPLMWGEYSRPDENNVGGDGKRVNEWDEGVEIQQQAVLEANSRTQDARSGLFLQRLRGDPKDSRVGHPHRVSTRLPGQNFDHSDSSMSVGMEGVDFDSPWAAKVAARILDGHERPKGSVPPYPNYRPAESANTPEKQIERFIKTIQSNIEWLYDITPEKTRKRSALWYDGANELALRLSRIYDVPHEAFIAVLATQSPQKDWYQNVALAERIVDTWRNQQDHAWDADMEATASRIFGHEKFSEYLDQIRGKSLSEISFNPHLQAMWVRVFSETHHDSGFREVLPEGTFGGVTLTRSGEPQSIAWQNIDAIAKSISVLADPSVENISRRLGGAPKVRSFYSNILEPNSDRGDVTIDTHAIAAAYVRALGAKSQHVGDAMGSGPVDSVNGMQGMYPIIAEAYRRAAASRGVLPRQMQSITWETARALFPSTMRSRGKKYDKIESLWKRYRSGRIGISKARQEVYDVALEGRSDSIAPDWDGSVAGIDEGYRDSSYAEVILGSGGLRGAGARGVGGELAGGDPGVAGLEGPGTGTEARGYEDIPAADAADAPNRALVEKVDRDPESASDETIIKYALRGAVPYTIKVLRNPATSEQGGGTVVGKFLLRSSQPDHRGEFRDRSIRVTFETYVNKVSAEPDSEALAMGAADVTWSIDGDIGFGGTNESAEFTRNLFATILSFVGDSMSKYPVLEVGFDAFSGDSRERSRQGLYETASRVYGKQLGYRLEMHDPLRGFSLIREVKPSSVKALAGPVLAKLNGLKPTERALEEAANAKKEIVLQREFAERHPFTEILARQGYTIKEILEDEQLIVEEDGVKYALNKAQPFEAVGVGDSDTSRVYRSKIISEDGSKKRNLAVTMDMAGGPVGKWIAGFMVDGSYAAPVRDPDFDPPVDVDETQKILSTTMAAIVEFIADVSPRQVQMSPMHDSSHAIRVRLYKRFGEKYGPMLGYKSETDEEGTTLLTKGPVGPVDRKVADAIIDKLSGRGRPERPGTKYSVTGEGPSTEVAERIREKIRSNSEARSDSREYGYLHSWQDQLDAYTDMIPWEREPPTNADDLTLEEKSSLTEVYENSLDTASYNISRAIGEDIRDVQYVLNTTPNEYFTGDAKYSVTGEGVPYEYPVSNERKVDLDALRRMERREIARPDVSDWDAAAAAEEMRYHAEEIENERVRQWGFGIIGANVDSVLADHLDDAEYSMEDMYESARSNISETFEEAASTSNYDGPDLTVELPAIGYDRKSKLLSEVDEPRNLAAIFNDEIFRNYRNHPKTIKYFSLLAEDYPQDYGDPRFLEGVDEGNPSRDFDKHPVGTKYSVAGEPGQPTWTDPGEGAAWADELLNKTRGYVPRFNPRSPISMDSRPELPNRDEIRARAEQIVRGTLEGDKPSSLDMRKFSLAGTDARLPGPQQRLVDRVAPKADEELSFGKKILGALKNPDLSWFRQKSINGYEALAKINDIIRKINPNDRRLMADTNALAGALFHDRATGLAYEAMVRGVPVYKAGRPQVIDFKIRLEDGSEVNGGLLEVLRPLFRNGEDFLRAWHTYRIGKLETRLDKEGKIVRTTAEERAAAEKLAELYPFLELVSENYNRWNSHVVQFLVDTGVISESLGEVFLRHSDYIPFFRQLYDESDGRLDKGVQALVGEHVNSMVRDGFLPEPTDEERASSPKVMFNSMTFGAQPKKRVGGKGSIVDPIEGIARNLVAAMEAGSSNVAAGRTMRDAILPGVNMARPVGDRSEATHTIRVKGEDRHFDVHDPLLYDCLTGMLDGNIPWLSFISVPSTILRETVTRSPDFIMANLLRDTLSSAVTSGSNFTPIVGTATNFFAGGISGRGEVPNSYNVLRGSGVIGGYDHGRDPKDMKKSFYKELSKQGLRPGKSKTPWNMMTSLWDYVGDVTTKSDAATRMAVYDDVVAAMLKEGGHSKETIETEAVFQALEIMNFSRRGNSPVMRVITAAIPFMNARVQGLDVLYRAATGKYSTNQRNLIKSRVITNFLARGMTLAVLSGLYALLVHDDDEWKNARPEVQDDNWFLPSFGDMPAMKIPIPFEVGVIFKVIPERAMRYFITESADSRQTAAALTRAIVTTFEFNIFGPQVAKPVLEAMTNHSFFTGREIIPTYMKKMEPWEQKRPTTNEFASLIGKAFNVAPLNVEHIIRGYTGTVGSYAMFMMDMALREMVNKPRPEMRADQWLIARRFLQSEYGGGPMAEFYDFKNAVERVAYTFNKMRREGRSKEAVEYARENRHILAMKSRKNALDRMATKLREQQTAIYLSDASEGEKLAALKRIEEKRNKIFGEPVQKMRQRANLPMEFPFPLSFLNRVGSGE